jgi:acylphosphatase
MSTVRYTIIVSGRVQGVFFRASAAEKARQLGLKGLVRNMTDGSVHIEAEGDEESLNKFVEWCRKGPPAASVKNCSVSKGDVRNYDNFVIDH